MASSRSKGFGLIEIMVVVSIIGVLSSVGAVATKQFKDKAKVAESQTNQRQIQNGLDVYASTEGGYPNPTQGERKLYCVGSTDCVFKGQRVPVRLNVDDMPEYTDLTPFDSGDGLTQGFVYMSCDDLTAVCDPSDTALIYGYPDDEYINFWGDLDSFEDDDFDWDDWSIDWDDYPDYTEDDEEESGFVCAPPNYPEGSFEAYSPSFSLEQPVIRSSYCTFDSLLGQYNCTMDCVNSTYHFLEYMVHAQYPYSYEYSCQEEAPNMCVQVLGTKYCNHDTTCD